ncbi:hypothetical protein AB0395_21875 [Streptosporangium sp. NPDC051023]|uniref:hypothetical protein n=1 Tax=Streptosporangium sp. NPDC051023 TaxID=3155410 RepID=UPI00344B9375
MDWGIYTAAVTRWEHRLGRAAPCPTDDRGRLAPHIVEWMMGLPLGHVTDVPPPPGMTAAGLRNARLHALGNGVVPQQAAHALKKLVERATAAPYPSIFTKLTYNRFALNGVAQTPLADAAETQPPPGT